MVFHIVTLALFNWGIACLFDEGMLLAKVGSWLESRVPLYLLKPTILCPACMASVWGTAYSLHLGLSPSEWVVLILATAGLNFIIMKHLVR